MQYFPKSDYQPIHLLRAVLWPHNLVIDSAKVNLITPGVFAVAMC